MNTALETIRTVVVDDEPLARDRLLRLLRAEEDVTVVAECGSGACAVEAVEEHRPDLVFLDIHLPEMDGFGVLDEARARHRFHVIFVTAYDQHAVRAFDVQALDYLLKPLDAARLHRAVQRARVQLHEPGESESGRESQTPFVTTWDRLAVRERNRVIFLRPTDIDWIEAEGNYVRLHVGPRSHLLRETMCAAEQRLAPRGFLRVSRSALVNLDRVRELQPLFHGDSVLVLHDGRQLVATRAFRPHLERLLAGLR
jgi:two-component system LytT family response regulator